tara:strand:+ start:208 stop:1137 length:930 start_codon:yes stop_codon:yes gene_type:complete
MKKRCYLVTGAAGFIGSALASKIIQEGSEVITVDNLSSGFESSIPSEVKFIKGDCSDKKTLSKLKNYNFDAIFHIAGQSSGEVSFEDPEYDLKSNTLSTLLLLQLALEKKCKKFIYASSMSVYGDQDTLPVDEESPFNPISLYAVGKIASENYMKIYSNYGIDCISLRLFNVYGPGQNLENLKQGMISIYLAQAIKDKRVVVKGSQNRFRDFIYIDDVIRVFAEAIKIELPSFDYFNVCTGKKTTVKEVLAQISDILPFDISLDSSQPSLGDQQGIFGNNKKLLKYFNIPEMLPLNEGLKKTVNEVLDR